MSSQNKDIYKDRYPNTKHKRYSLDDCLMAVKKKYPECWMEGSAGLQRMFMVQVGDKNRMVGHAFSSGRLTKDFNYTWYVRVFEKPVLQI